MWFVPEEAGPDGFVGGGDEFKYAESPRAAIAAGGVKLPSNQRAISELLGMVLGGMGGLWGML
jgi:hypothetical protein